MIMKSWMKVMWCLEWMESVDWTQWRGYSRRDDVKRFTYGRKVKVGKSPIGYSTNFLPLSINVQFFDK